MHERDECHVHLQVSPAPSSLLCRVLIRRSCGSGQSFPVHPLDLTVMQQTEIEVNGQAQNVTFCMNTYQYLALDPTAFSGFDAILGDAFLRNVYAS